MIDEYLLSKVTTATPYQLHLMVIDGAVRHARTAETALAKTNVAEARAALAQARLFVGEMLAGLDAKQLPDVVDRLKALFAYVLRNLVKAELERDETLVADAIAVLHLHRETWLKLGERLQEETAIGSTSSTDERFCWSS